MDIKPVLAKLAGRHDLTDTEMRTAMGIIMSGEATPAQIGAFLMGLRAKGETVAEIAAAVAVLRQKMVPVKAPAHAMDIVGTGGDGSGTFNISTTTALVVASLGQPVAKHGNRALSSRSGAAEALVQLGVNIELPPAAISRCIQETGIGFMFAPAHHPAMAHVGPARKEMGVRTMFNLLGPQSNPAGVKKYLLGVFSADWVEPVARALLANGATHALVVHGSDGMDEITTTGPTMCAAIAKGAIRTFEINPADAGLPVADGAGLKGGDPAHNAKALREVLAGAKNPYRDIVVLNAAAALLVCASADNLLEGAIMAAEALDSGKAAATLDQLINISNSEGANG
ncbi:MAG: anthranilate phosphoribosyltransferase [Alphaproteobacteria bacterium]|nr:anthranilate phosphoribosyltransferase [Alphaproteobacteria bacterium]